MSVLLSRVTPVPRARPARRSSSRWWHLLLAPIALLFALPFVQMFLTALTPASEINKFPPAFIPAHLTLDGFVRLFQTSGILLWMRNTIVVSGVGVLSHMVLCCARSPATGSRDYGSAAATSGSSRSSRQS